MKWKLEQKEPFKVMGYGEEVDCTDGNNFVRIPQIWQEVFENGTHDKLLAIPYKPTIPHLCAVNAVMGYDYSDDQHLNYMIGVIDFEGSAVCPPEFKTVNVDSFNWAIFESDPYSGDEVTEKTQALWHFIFGDWFQKEAYEHAPGPELELYYEYPDGTMTTEVWIPVISK